MISVIIPVKDGIACIRTCLEGVLAQGGLENEVEVLVVDDGSRDETPLLAEAMGARVLRQENAGPAAARNRGAQAARGEILAFTDADCVPHAEWLKHLTAPFADPEVVGAKGVYRTRQASLVARFVQQEYESKYARMRHQASIDFIDTYSAAYRREVFLQNGGFEPAFPVPSVEDQEFSFRLARKGYRMVFAPEAVVYHQHDRGLGEYFRRKFGIGYWKAFMLRWLPEKALSDSHTLPSQRVQIFLLSLALASAALSALYPAAGWVCAACFALFFLSATPFLKQIAGRDPAVLFVAPLLLLVRALAQAYGLGAGFLLPPRAQRRQTAGLNLTARVVKRTLDLAGGCIGLFLSLPFMLVSALAIKLEDGGAVFFFQERAGENGKPFLMIKLRTMEAGAEGKINDLLKDNPLKEPVFKFPNDPRVTRVGRVLRRWSLDETPQFWNVLRGDMSLVGPRPEETWVVVLYNDEQRQRLAFKPGITGPMQVSGRGELGMEERLALELEYIRHYSLWKDLAILARTLPAVLRGEGAF